MELLSTTPPKVYTLEEYFALEETAETRHEFVHGKLIAMPGESKIANKIVGNCHFTLRTALRGKPFDIFMHDVRLIVRPEQIYRYPDLVVAPTTDQHDTHAITQPALIIEVLSESTARTDRDDKLKEYSQMERLHYYLLVEQDKISVECFRRNGTKWEYEWYEALSEVVEMPFFPLALPLSEVYEGVFGA